MIFQKSSKKPFSFMRKGFLFFIFGRVLDSIDRIATDFLSRFIRESKKIPFPENKYNRSPYSLSAQQPRLCCFSVREYRQNTYGKALLQQGRNLLSARIRMIPSAAYFHPEPSFHRIALTGRASI
jgi:hypothetical protein